MRPQISQSEFILMEVLWAENPLGASEVAKRLDNPKGWSIRTIKTMLARLVDKEVLMTEPDGRRYLYSPLIQREAYLQSVTKRFTDQLFNGRAAPLVAHLASGEGLSDEDIAELEALIATMKKGER